MIEIYHVFADNTDGFTRDKELAYEWYSGMEGDKRLYVEYYETEEDVENDKMQSEDCLEAEGDYPL